MSEHVSIIIPAFNQLDYCKQCVTSVLANTQVPYRLILVDNGSTDGVAEFFDSVPGATVVHSPTNVGFAAGVNLGLEQASLASPLHAGGPGGAGHVVLLNSDTIVPSGWLSRLLEAMGQADDIGMVGPMSNNVSGTQQIDGLSFSTEAEIDEYALKLHSENRGKIRDATRLVGFCLLIRDTLFERIGKFDESYGVGNYEDDDYCLRARQVGYRLVIAEDAFVFHYGSRTFLGMGITGQKWDELTERNRRQFAEKWNLLPTGSEAAAQLSRQLNSRAKSAAHDGNIAEALRLFKSAIEACPDSEDNYHDLALALWQAGEHDRAFEYLVRALDLNPKAPAVRSSLSRVAKELGRMSEVESLPGWKEKDVEIVVREYRPEDRDEWMRVHAIILSTSHAWNYTIQERPEYEGHQSTRLVAELNGRIIGLIDTQYENELGESCFLKDSLGGYVLEFGRLPEYAGQRIGGLLIEATVEDAKKKGFHRLEFWTQDRAAQRYYQRLGMKNIGRHYRFRIKPPQEIADIMMKDVVGIEYLYCACMPEEWPLVQQKFDIIRKPALEPHLCVGYELRF